MRRIAVFTATRAEYGLLRPILSEIEDSDDLELQLIVAGAHLSRSHGRTVETIEADQIPIAERLPTLVDDDSAVGTSTSLALTVSAVAGALSRLRPDMLLLLGDRYEALAAASAAMMARVPIAHLHGGEATEGAIDEAIRHSITKMSHLHLLASDRFARRVVQLGEQPERTHVVGAPGLDTVRSTPRLSRDDLSDALNWDVGDRFLVVTYHPVTLDPAASRAELTGLLQALECLEDYRVLMTAPNADPDSGGVRDVVRRFVVDNAHRAHFVESLGSLRYVNALCQADAAVGNSSSGLIEAPFLGTPTVNIGSRQQGRPRADSVIDVGPDPNTIVEAIRSASATPTSPSGLYGDGHTAPRVTEILSAVNLAGLLVKRFRDMEV